MTDINVGGVVREALDATAGELRVGGLAREALHAGAGLAQVNLAGMAREVLGAFGDGTDGGPGPGAGGVTAHHVSRRRIVQMVNDNPRLARKLGIRGKLQILE